MKSSLVTPMGDDKSRAYSDHWLGTSIQTTDLVFWQA